VLAKGKSVHREVEAGTAGTGTAKDRVPGKPGGDRPRLCQNPILSLAKRQKKEEKHGFQVSFYGTVSVP
jgi:hypothetical protein